MRRASSAYAPPFTAGMHSRVGCRRRLRLDLAQAKLLRRNLEHLDVAVLQSGDTGRSGRRVARMAETAPGSRRRSRRARGAPSIARPSARASHRPTSFAVGAVISELFSLSTSSAFESDFKAVAATTYACGKRSYTSGRRRRYSAPHASRAVLSSFKSSALASNPKAVLIPRYSAYALFNGPPQPALASALRGPRPVRRCTSGGKPDGDFQNTEREWRAGYDSSR